MFFILFIGNENWIGYTYVPIKARIFRIVNKNRWRIEIRVLNENTEKEYQGVGYSTKYSNKPWRQIIEE